LVIKLSWTNVSFFLYRPYLSREAIENWPECDFLISFYSTGFPLQKAIDYVDLRKPICVNNLPLQQLLLDRRCVLKILDEIEVPTPRRFVSQAEDLPNVSEDLIEFVEEQFGLDFHPDGFPKQIVKQLDKDTIELNGQTMRKPFVEKPVSGEDHNINIVIRFY
jgi:inositol hexakisphosphate/diphosphoinositol-pentakisphosphate kinase